MLDLIYKIGYFLYIRLYYKQIFAISFKKPPNQGATFENPFRRPCLLIVTDFKSGGSMGGPLGFPNFYQDPKMY